MNIAYLKVTCGLRFHLFFFFFFLGAGLLMSFHGHSCPSVMIICIQPQAWGASGRGNDGSRFFFCFFWATGMVPPWDLVPYANCGGTDFVHDIVHIAQTGPQGHFSVGPQRGRGLSPSAPPPPPVHATGKVLGIHYMQMTGLYGKEGKILDIWLIIFRML